MKYDFEDWERAYQIVVSGTFVESQPAVYALKISELTIMDNSSVGPVADFFLRRFRFDVLVEAMRATARSQGLETTKSHSQARRSPPWGGVGLKRSEVERLWGLVVSMRRMTCGGRFAPNNPAMSRCINAVGTGLDAAAGTALAPVVKRGQLNWRNVLVLPPVSYWPVMAFENDEDEEEGGVVATARSFAGMILNPFGSAFEAGQDAGRAVVEFFGGDTDDDDDDDDDDDEESTFFDEALDTIKDGLESGAKGTGKAVGGAVESFGDGLDEGLGDEDEKGVFDGLGGLALAASVGPAVLTIGGLALGGALMWRLGSIFFDRTLPAIAPHVTETGRVVVRETAGVARAGIDKLSISGLLGAKGGDSPVIDMD